MKVLIWAVILACLAGSLFLGTQALWDQDPGIQLASAVGEEKEGKVQVAVALMLAQKMDRPMADADGVVDWDGWLVKHWELFDADGNRVEMKKSGRTTAIPANKDPGTTDFYVTAELAPGKKYSLDFIPFTGTGEKYGVDFIATKDDFPFMRRYFRPRK